MDRAIVIVGTMDTKGDQVEYLKQQIEVTGHPTIIIDIGVVGTVPFEPTYDRDEVASRMGTTIQEIIDLENPPAGLGKLAAGATKIVKGLHAEQKIDGIVAVGGSQGTAVVLEVLKSLPTGFPKLLISTVAYSASLTADSVNGDDIMLVPWVAGLFGLNRIVKGVLENSAGVIVGAADKYNKRKTYASDIVGISSLGPKLFPALKEVKQAIEERGYEAAVYHTNGMGGRSYEKAIADGLIRFSLDLHGGVELLDYIMGGSFSAGPDRLEAAGRAGIPQIVSPGIIATFHWTNDKPLPDKYKDRVRIWHNTLVLAIISSQKDTAKLGTLMAEKLNRAKGPVTVILPMGNLEGGGPMPVPPRPLAPKNPVVSLPELAPHHFYALYDGIRAFRKTFLKEINSQIRIVEIDADLHDPRYIETVMKEFDVMNLK